MNVTPPRRLRARAIVTVLGLIVSMAYTVGATALVYAHRPLPESLDITADAVTTLFAGIAFMAWLYLARVNLDGLGVVGLRWRPGWTVGGWLVPLANLVIPLLVVREVDRASRVRATAVGRVGRPGRAVFVLWAIGWVGYLLVGVGLDYPPSTGPLTILSTVLVEAAGVFAILLVRRITTNQDAAMALPPPARPVLVGPPPAISAAGRPALPPAGAPSTPSPPARSATGRPAQSPSVPSPSVPSPSVPSPPGQSPHGQSPHGQSPHGQSPHGQSPSAQIPPDAPPPTGPAVDPWPGADY